MKLKLILAAFSISIVSLSVNASSQSGWIYFMDAADGKKWDVNEVSIDKRGGYITLDLRVQRLENSSTLLGLFSNSQGYDAYSYVASCDEPKAALYASRKIDSAGNVSEEGSATSIDIAITNMKEIKKTSIISLAAKKYCSLDSGHKNLQTMSDITAKNPVDQFGWTLIRSNVTYPITKSKYSYLIDPNSLANINGSIFKIATLSILEEAIDIPSLNLKNAKSLISVATVDCQKSLFRNEMEEVFNNNGALIRRTGKGDEVEYKEIPANSNIALVGNMYCPQIAKLPLNNENILARPNNVTTLLSAQPNKNDLSQPIPRSYNQGKRIALVIGNSSYKSRPLINPKNDADDISVALKTTGFEVIDLRDATLSQMRSSIRLFGDKLLMSDVGLVYYSGHGIEVRGQNYLIPVNADIKRSDEIADQSINMGLILEKMETAQKGVNILIVDACRDDPFGRSFRSSSMGLAQVDAPRGTIVAFATSPGKVAADGEGRNSPYTKNLVKTIQLPNLPIEQVFKQVRRAVQDETKNQQTPWENTSLSGDFYFSTKK
jgi:hypothetical protein